MNVLVSVIVPIYNAEKYLENCLKSILSQDFNDFELILVNDGSTDSSLNICNQFKSLDSRIKVIDKANGGVSSARNKGLKVAKGEWIYFVDADDTIIRGLFDIFKTNIEADIIQFGYNTIQTDGIINTKSPQMDVLYSSADEFISKASFKILTLWIHFVKANIIKENNIYFSEKIKYAEDLEFMIKCYACASAIQIKPIIGYNYYIRESSAMSKAHTFDNAKNHLVVAEQIINFYELHNIKKHIFFHSRIDYMVKSYFSFCLFDYSIGKNEVLEYFKLFYLVNSNIKNFFLKNMPNFYFRLLILFYKR